MINIWKYNYRTPQECNFWDSKNGGKKCKDIRCGAVSHGHCKQIKCSMVFAFFWGPNCTMAFTGIWTDLNGSITGMLILISSDQSDSGVSSWNFHMS